MVKYSPMFPKQAILCRPHCKTTSSFPLQAQATLASFQPPSELQFTTLTFGQLYLDCKVIGDYHRMLSIVVILAMLAKPPELYLFPRECLTLSSTPCNGSAVRRSPGLRGSDLQILLLLLPSWQRPAMKSQILTGLPPKDLSTTTTHDRCEPHGRAAESCAAGTLG